ncbi:la-related protein 1, partial [Tremellales sp. Uapishka_1]
MSSAQSPPSVFNALGSGSYADRMKKAQQLQNSRSTTNGDLTAPSTSAPTTNSSPAMTPKTRTPAPATPPVETKDEGTWKTVSTSRSRPKMEEKRSHGNGNGGSNGKDWRERPAEKEKEKEREKSSTSRSVKKSAAAPTVQQPAKSVSTPVPSTSASAPTGVSKPAWGLTTPTITQTVQAPSTISTTIETPKQNGLATVPSSPSLNGTTAVSPHLSASTETDIVKDKEDDPSWRPRPETDKEIEKVMPPPPAPKQAAPPPAVNAWDIRKKSLPAPAANGSGKSVSVSLGEKEKTVEKKKSTNRVKGTTTPVVADPVSWPDVKTAATVGGKEEKKEKKDDETREKKDDEMSVVDESGVAGKKPKWIPIPAADLQAAADKAAAADLSRRQTSSSGRKRTPTASQGESSKGTKKPLVNGSGNAKPSPLSVSTDPANKSNGEEIGSTKNSVPPSPNSYIDPTSTSMRFGTGPLNGHSKSAGPTPNLPQHSFNPILHPANPVRPRGRAGENGGIGGGRGTFGRGRGGGFRSNSAMPSNGRGYVSPTNGNITLPENMYQRGYNFQPPPLAQQGQPFAYYGIYDQSQYYNRGLPPPPMPATIIPNIDPLRFYILGQVEFYFSMQNLAMDFFLRQQMDSEGWIEISTIASFNRVKSLTPDPALVKEVMLLSSLLEVRDEKVRLSGPDSRKWVLPDAKKCAFGPESVVSGTGEGEQDREIKDTSMGVPGEESKKFGVSDVGNAVMKHVAAAARGGGDEGTSSTASVLNEDKSDGGDEAVKIGGEGEGEGEMTPATSMSGDGDGEVKSLD